MTLLLHRVPAGYIKASSRMSAFNFLKRPFPESHVRVYINSIPHAKIRTCNPQNRLAGCSNNRTIDLEYMWSHCLWKVLVINKSHCSVFENKVHYVMPNIRTINVWLNPPGYHYCTYTLHKHFDTVLLGYTVTGLSLLILLLYTFY